MCFIFWPLIKKRAYSRRSFLLFCFWCSLVTHQKVDKLLLFNQKGADNFLTSSFVAQNTSVCSEDLLFAERQPLSFSGSARFNTLQLDAGHGTFWKGWPFLEVLEHQFTTGCAYLLPTIRLGVVRQSSSVGNTLNHLKF